MLRVVYETLLTYSKTISGATPFLRLVQYSIYQLALMKKDPAYPTDSLDFNLNFVKVSGITYTIDKSPDEAIKSLRLALFNIKI